MHRFIVWDFRERKISLWHVKAKKAIFTQTDIKLSRSTDAAKLHKLVFLYQIINTLRTEKQQSTCYFDGFVVG
jgi:hypothetical protein